jgi:hypothetical protein
MAGSIRLRPEAATGICEKFHKAAGRPAFGMVLAALGCMGSFSNFSNRVLMGGGLCG